MNKARLEYEMALRNVTRQQMCETLGISRTAFYRKCTGKSEFTLSEIRKIMEFLKLDSPMEIFFSGKVS